MEPKDEFVRTLVGTQHLQITGLKLRWNQFWILFKKCLRFKITIGFTLQLVLPMVLLLFVSDKLNEVIHQKRANQPRIHYNNVDSNLEIDESINTAHDVYSDHVDAKMLRGSQFCVYTLEPGADETLVKQFLDIYQIKLNNCYANNIQFKQIRIEDVDKEFGESVETKFVFIFGKHFSTSNLNYTLKATSQATKKISKWSIDSPDLQDSLNQPLFVNLYDISNAYMLRMLTEAFNDFFSNTPLDKIQCKENKYFSLPFQFNMFHKDIGDLQPMKISESSFGYLIQLLFLLWGGNILSTICQEKANKSREFLKLMGASRFLIYASHFTFFFICLFFLSIILIIFFFQNNYHHLIPLPISFSILITSISQFILLCFLISVFFNNSIWATMAFYTVNVFFMTFLLKVSHENLFTYLVLIANPCNSIKTMFEMGYAFDLNRMTFIEILFEPQAKQHNFSLFNMILYQVFVNAVYLFLIYYFDNVWPFQYGVAKPFYFICDPKYWSCSQHQQNEEDYSQLIQTGDKFEANTSSPIICIRQVQKGYYTKYGAFAYKQVIKKLSMDVCSNQLTVLLGFNGAGKTTLMDMITGIQSLNSGSIFIKNKNISSNMSAVKQMIGLCPQENIFYSELTVKQNLSLAGVLRGVPNYLLLQRISLIAEKLGIKDKLDLKAKKLSGGMKRRLCLGCSFIGYNDVLVFDEPTSGLDPETRRQLWDVFIELRKCKTILLTTHFMEEADVLGDRIAILNQGRLVCNGSPAFLKKAYNTGYLLKTEVQDDHNPNEILQFIKSFVPPAQMVNTKKNELDFRIPSFDYEMNCSLNSKLSDLFEELKNNQETLKINTFGLNNTSLEDVFIKAGETDTVIELKEISSNNDLEKDGSFIDILNYSSDRKQVTFKRQLKAFFIKRICYHLRMPFTIVFQLLIPLFLIIIYYRGMCRNADELIQNPQLMPVHEQVQVYSKKNVFFALDLNNDTEMKIATQYKDKAKRLFDLNVELVPSSDQLRKGIFNNGTPGLFQKHTEDHFYYMFGLTFNVDPDIQFNFFYNLFYTWSFPIMIDTFPTFDIIPNSAFQAMPVAINKISTIYAGTVLLIISHLISFIVPFIVMSQTFLLVPNSEMSRKSLLIQRIAGISNIKYWFFNLAYDWIVYSLIISIFISTFIFIDCNWFNFVDPLAFKEHWFYHIIVFSCSGICFIIFCYILSAVQSELEFSNFIYYLTFICTSLLPVIYSYVTKYFMRDSFFGNDNILLILYILLPPFNFLQYFTKQVIFKFENYAKVYSPKADQMFGPFQLKYNTIFNFDPILFHVILSIVSAILFVVFLIYLKPVADKIERLFVCLAKLACFKSCRSKSVEDSNEDANAQMNFASNVDPRVLAEEKLTQEIIQNKQTSNYLLTVSKLKKKFGDFTAVNEISFAVQQNECFGLLGLNGAGKTTTFSMLTGDQNITSGQVYLLDHPVHDDVNTIYKLIAYCPQIECNFENLTVKDILIYYARIIGLDRLAAQKVTSKLIDFVDLSQYKNINSDTLSGGNKRKLSLAISLISNRDLTYLDEPTTGVDPVARRKIWETLNSFKKHEKKSFILTSHSMDECEYLCNRIAIMGKGKFFCLGTYSQLRDNYAQGYKLHIRLRMEHISNQEYTKNLENDVTKTIENSQLKDMHLNSMIFFIKQRKGMLSLLFKQANQLQNTWNFEDYTISETTLEEVFLSFSKNSRRESTIQPNDHQKTNVAFV